MTTLKAFAVAVPLALFSLALSLPAEFFVMASF